jgi:hypothetical protein
MLPPVLVSSFATGGRIIHRVTPKQNNITPQESGGIVTFDFGGEGTLVFRNARLLPSSPLAPMGRWVEEYPAPIALLTLSGSITTAGAL